MWYQTGTVTTVNGSASVVGVGTAWLGQVSAGDLFTIDRVTFYKVAMVGGEGNLTLATPYGGASAGGQIYGIVLNFETASVNFLSAAVALLTPTDRVTAVFGRSGAVTAQAGDYTAAQVTVTPAGGIAATEVQGALVELDAEKAALAGATFTGAVTAPTPETGDNSTRLATTAYVKVQGYITSGEAPVQSVAGKTGVVTLEVADVSGAAPLASPALTGTPTAPTATAGTSSTQIATTAFVRGQGYITSGEAPVQSVAGKTGMVTLAVADVAGAAPLASPVLTGTPTAPTPATADSSTTLATTAFVKAQSLDDLAPPTGALSLAGQRLVNVADPTDDQDAATKAYVDSVAQGLDAKASVRAATTANITFSGAQTIDGVAVGAGDRVLVKNQTNPAGNGIYVAASGAWARSADANSWNELVSSYVFVEAGTVNANAGFTCTVQPGGTLGTTPVTWVQFSGAGQVIAGTGLLKSGNTLSVDTSVIAALASPAFSGTPTAPTAGIDTNTTQLATTAFVVGQASSSGDGTPTMNGTAARGTSTHYARADHVHPTDTSRAPLASAALTGTPTAPTPTTSDNSTSLATTAFVKNQGYVTAATAPVLSVAGKTGAVTLVVGDVSGAAPLASPTFTGAPAAPTPAASDNSTKLATTAFVKSQNSASLAMAYAAALCF